MKGPVPIHLAVEDDLSAVVLRRALESRPVQYAVGATYNKGGYGYLKKNVAGFNNAAKACPFLLLTDLDKHECPPELVSNWLAGRPKHEFFLFRVAVREVESWLLGDLGNLASFLHLKRTATIPAPESLADPKHELLKLASGSQVRQIREAMVGRDKSGNLFQGPDYNGTLARFVVELWDTSTAASVCPSLQRLFGALQRFEARFARQ